MERNTFRLQSVLNLRTRDKHKAAKEFALAMRTLKAHESELKQVTNQLDRLGRTRSDQLGSQKAEVFHTIRTRMSKYRSEISSCRARINAQRKVAETRRSAVVTARQEEKKLEFLKTRDHAAWLLRVTRAEQRQTDETAGRIKHRAFRVEPPNSADLRGKHVRFESGR